MENILIKINGEEKRVEKKSEQKLGALLSELNQTYSKESQVVASIKINGRELTEEDELTLKDNNISDLGEIEIFISSPADLAYETLDTLTQYLARLQTSIERAASLYNEKNYLVGDAYFAKSIDGLDLFIQTIGSIKIALKIGLNPQIALIEAELVSIMNDLLDAKRQNNFQFMAQLLESDLKKNIEEWLTISIPIIRKWKNN